jgi:hypothetical protein
MDFLLAKLPEDVVNRGVELCGCVFDERGEGAGGNRACEGDGEMPFSGGRQGHPDVAAGWAGLPIAKLLQRRDEFGTAQPSRQFQAWITSSRT